MLNTVPVRLGVIGNPVRHSRSPELHAYFGRINHVLVQYERYHAEFHEFEQEVSCFFRNGGQGLNVTLPFKIKAAEMADKLTPRARMVGAVNTLSCVDGELVGDTTDGEGFIRDITRLAGERAFQGDVVILGAGGAVRSLLPDLMALNPKRLLIFNRTAVNAQSLIKEIETWRSNIGFKTLLVAGDLLEFIRALRKSSCKVSLLVQGSSGSLSEIISQELTLNLSQTYCYDLNYGERAQEFLHWCELNRAKHRFDGFGMLVGQAAASFKIWTGKTVDTGDIMGELKTQNIWMDSWWTPPFHAVDIDLIKQAIEFALQNKEAVLDERFFQLDNNKLELNWHNFVHFYEAANDKLTRVWGVLSHLNSVCSSDASRAAFNELQPKLSDHYTKEQQNPVFKRLVSKLVASPEAQAFTPAQNKWCANLLRDFRLAGADLTDSQQVEFAALEMELSRLSTQFSDLVLDATEAWYLDVSPDDLPGVPATTIETAQAVYKSAEPDGSLDFCRLTLKGPCYLAVIKFCENQDIRRKIYEAYATRASEQGPHAGQFDTTDLIKQILYKRSQQAQLLGFADYADYSLATKMAKSSMEVTEFLHHLGSLSKNQALKEKAELERFAAQELGLVSLQPWDYSFASEKLKAFAFSLDAEAVRDYFPTDHVLKALCTVLEQVFSLSCKENKAVPVYNDEVIFLELSREGKLIGGLFIDLYARDKKRSGAWMDECRQRLSHDQEILPIAYLVCNSSPPTKTKPSLMTHDEVVTLFHETGHCLHHVLTQVDVAGVAGIHGVEWDAVEVPSQFLENWCYQERVIPLLSRHYLKHTSLPKDELAKIIAARNFQSGLTMMKQLEYSMFDMQIHSTLIKNANDVPDTMKVLNQVREEVGVLPIPDWHRFANGFTHIFAGGYAAGYYGYKWAEVYAADVFTRFNMEGSLSPQLGNLFFQEWLSKGGVRSASENFQAFMGRDVDLNALIKDLGILPVETL